MKKEYIIVVVVSLLIIFIFLFKGDNDKINDALLKKIENHLLEENTNDIKSDYEKPICYIASLVYGNNVSGKNMSVYLWAMIDCYNESEEISSSSMPYKFNLKKDGKEYVIVKYEFPRDGSYKEDMKKLFPVFIRYDMEKIYDDGTANKLKKEIEKQIRESNK